MKNNLANDSSPYLQQHRNNPVFWQTWSEETLLLAKAKSKPILLSIGYSSCHWCHVMAHESFEDIETAKIMNNNFINIKVDREERPDLDFVFQSSYQLFNQSGGGWPLTMFLDENGVPFMGGTYFPKFEKGGLPSFKNILIKVSEAYKENKEKIINQKSLIVKSLELKKNSVLKQDLEPILENILKNLDPVNGGYNGSPKFPIYYVYETLLYFYNKTKNKKYLKPIEIIIKQLCSKGIYDHVEGGIARYTTDEKWLIPHFEKMLYDNCQFILLLSKYSIIKKDIYFLNKVEKTINFLNKNFIDNSTNLLGTAYDADSEGKEGKYYVFAYDEIKNIRDIDKYFEIKIEGNWEGKIILSEIKAPPETIIEELLKIRQSRTKPFFDKKNQLDLNCLWISSLISAHKVLPKNNYLELAEKFYKNVEKKFFLPKIHHSYSKEIVFLEDYAYLINALIDLAETTMNLEYRINAKNICLEVIKKFFNEDKKIFQKNQIISNDIFLNPIDISDSTIPNGNSIMLLNFTRLGLLEEAKKLNDSLQGYLNIYKSHMASSLKSLDFFSEISRGKKCNENGCEI
ncbi:MAG: thioredoxin domain-containing protein [Pelagibacteraceae bacterium]